VRLTGFGDHSDPAGREVKIGFQFSEHFAWIHLGAESWECFEREPAGFPFLASASARAFRFAPVVQLS
jgi:hypothetical protein